MRCLEVVAGTGTASRSPSNPRLKTDVEKLAQGSLFLARLSRMALEGRFGGTNEAIADTCNLHRGVARWLCFRTERAPRSAQRTCPNWKAPCGADSVQPGLSGKGPKNRRTQRCNSKSWQSSGRAARCAF